MLRQLFLYHRLYFRMLSGLLFLGLIGEAYGQEISHNNYIGSRQCAQCHRFEYMVWSSSAHARAHLSLNANQIKDVRCANCHTLALADDNNPLLQGVQCESCHGPGKYYYPHYVMKDKELSQLLGLLELTPKNCLTCHTSTAPSLSPFEYNTAWSSIDHGKLAKEAWLNQHGGVLPLIPTLQANDFLDVTP